MAPAAPNFPRYHCACASSSTSLQPSATHPSTTHSLHSLDSLYFCDDCDAIRCERCVQVEITSYYCPNCLFEVPNASVRAERNRYAAIDLQSHNASKLTCLTQSYSEDAHEIASNAPTAHQPFTSSLQTRQRHPSHPLLFKLVWDSRRISYNAKVANGPVRRSICLSRSL